LAGDRAGNLVFSYLFSILFVYLSSLRQQEEKLNMSNQNKRFIRLPEVMNKTGYGKAWIYKLISEGRFPKPVKIGIRAIAFVESEVDEWMDKVIHQSRLVA
jgi:prophage regulatory protein